MKANLAPAPDRGGPVNLRGIHYQLVSTFREVEKAVRIVSHDGTAEFLTSVIITIEPRGGGDSAVFQGGLRRVQQIKTHQGAWSLVELVKRVFPDLFRAYCSDPGVAEVELITDGQLDEQAQGLRNLIGELKKSNSKESDLLPWFRGRARRSSNSACKTVADLIDFFAVELSGNITDKVSNEATHRDKIKGFLSRLSLRAGLSFDDQEIQCREFLEGRGIAPGGVPHAIDQVVGYLLRRGKHGNHAFTFYELSVILNLAQQDLNNWPSLSGLSRDLILSDLARPRPGYMEGQDVRRYDPLTPELLSYTSRRDVDQRGGSWSSDRLKPIVIVGKSGMGKTWLLARAACQLGHAKYSLDSPGPALLWLSSQQDPRSDLEAAARRFCDRLWGHERPLSLESLADRISKLAVSRSLPWLIVFVDGVRSRDYFDKLDELDHGELGVLMVISASFPFGDGPLERPSLRLLPAPGFNPDEVLCFLELRGSFALELPPVDVRKLLETPIFSALYAALKNNEVGWQPDDEYALIQRFWVERVARPRPQAADALARLSCRRLREAAATDERPSQFSESWTVAELTDAGLSREDLEFFEASAILARDNASRSYSFNHERILQWAAAEGAARAFLAGSFPADELSETCAAILIGESQARWTFGYLPADLLWLLLDPDLPAACRSAAETLLARLEHHRNFLRLGDWLTTLGSRLVSLLFIRLRSADLEDSAILYTYRDALKQIQSVEVAQHATGLLEASSLELQEIGVQILEKREHAPVLDLLWALYQEWWAAAHSPRTQSSGRREGPWMYHVSIGEKAIRRSVRNRPEWLEARLLASSSLGGANSTLLFLLASTPKGEVVWKRHKEFIRGRLADDHQRGFVRCIISFRDLEERSWLESKVNERRDLVAPSARGALALLAPESALAPVEPEASLDLALGRGWWLPLARIQRPIETAHFLKEMILGSEDPIRTVFSFSGFELWYLPPVVEFILEIVQKELILIKEGRFEPGKDHLYAPLLRLSDCNTLDHLELFWDVRQRGLESDLADWLSDRGPNDTGCVRRGSEEGASEVLRLMAGPGLARVGARILELAQTWPGGQDGLHSAVREPDARAIAVIRSRALDPTLSTPPMKTHYPILQRFCVEALAYLRDFEGFALGVVQWGLELSPDLGAYLDGNRGAPEVLNVAKEALEQIPIPPGAFLLLGFHGGAEALDYLRMKHASCVNSPDLELSWIIGLDYSLDSSIETLASFTNGLTSADERIQFSSWSALLRRIEDPKVQELVLSASDEGKIDSAQLSAHLLDIEVMKPAIAERLWRRRREDARFLFNYGSQLEEFAVLGTDEVKVFLLEQATGATNPVASAARHSAIRGLAIFDREVALRAAIACRKGQSSSEDMDWPSLLVDVGGSAALPYLRESLAKDRDVARLHATGEALRAGGQLNILLTWLCDEDPRVREGACYACCAQTYDLQFEQSVIRCCLDPEEDVRTAAHVAFDRLWRGREVDQLIKRLHIEPNAGRRWALIDSALGIGYPGVLEGFGRISWFSELIAGRPYYEQKYAVDRLKERRKELVEELKRKSQEFREDT